MSSPVVTVYENDNIESIAKLMRENKVGCIIITNKKSNPVGVITDRNIVERLVARNLIAKKVKAKEIMTTPLITIEPEADITEAARRMSKLDIRRLVVIREGELIGIISSKDIVIITPSLIEVITESVKINQEFSIAGGYISTGYCGGCGQWSDSLRDTDGQLLCEDCRAETNEN
jgi:signal-transduction protein with cAMP-binding, CBS, and nucleotidyltransferase domain